MKDDILVIDYSDMLRDRDYKKDPYWEEARRALHELSRLLNQHTHPTLAGPKAPPDVSYVWAPYVPVVYTPAGLFRELPRCECGAGACGSTFHSDWCPLA